MFKKGPVGGNVLELRGVNVFYGPYRVLRNVFLRIDSGNIVSIIGPRGAGKSTLLKAVSGVVQNKDGAIRYRDRDIMHCSPCETLFLGISLVPEGGQLFPGLSVQDNLLLGAHFYRNRKFKSDIREKLEEVYRLFPPLRGCSKRVARTLDSGERQMTAMGRALMARPTLLLLDEPCRGLTPETAREIYRVMRRVNEQGTAIVLAEEDLREDQPMAAKGYVLEGGRLVEGREPF